jgi:hypothetical protein
VITLMADPFLRSSPEDVCLTCLEYRVQPVVVLREDGRAEFVYLCRCGAGWTCQWPGGAVAGWGAP